MSIRDKVADFIAGTDRESRAQELADAQVGEVVRREVSAVLAETDMSYTRDDANGWRELGGGGINAYLNGFDRAKMLKVASGLFRKSPLAAGILSTITNMVASDEVEWQANDEAVEQILRDHWDGPINRWNRKLRNRMFELSLYGEQCYPVFINPINGFVVVRNVSPRRIKSVKPNEDDIERIDKVILTDPDDPIRTIPLQVVNVDTDIDSPTFGKQSGECIFLRANVLSDDPRGYSDLLTMADWLKTIDNMLFATGERALLQLQHIWDVKVNGGTDEDITKIARQYKNAKPGSVVAHNGDVEVNPASVELAADETAVNHRTLLRHTIAATGMPEHALGMGGETTATTADAMNPTMNKMLQSRRQQMMWWLEDFGNFALDQAQIAGTLKGSVDREFEISMPDIREEDTEKTAREFVNMVSAASAGESNGYITAMTASALVAKAAEKFGIKYDPDEESKAARAERDADIMGEKPEVDDE